MRVRPPTEPPQIPSSTAVPSLVAGDRSGRWAMGVSLVVLGLLVSLFVAKGVRVARLPVDQMVSWNVMIDDGYYYLQVARNLARGEGSTFDRINKTNGYQPLWTLALVPIYAFTNDPGIGMRAALVLAALLGAVALVLGFIALSRLCGSAGALLFCGVVVANPYFLKILQGGLETPMLFVCIMGLLAFLALYGARVLDGERRPCLVFGLILAATVLARLDTAIILFPVALLMALWRGGTQGAVGARVRRALWIALPGVAVLAPYMLWNWISHGGLVPISGQVKAWVVATRTPTWELFRATEQWRGVSRTLGELSWLWSPQAKEPSLGQITSHLALPGVLLLVLGLRLLWSPRARSNTVAVAVLLGSTVGVIAHGLYMFFGYRSCSHWNYHYFFPFSIWHTVLLVLTGALLFADLGLALDRLLGGRVRRGFAAAGAAVAMPLLGGLAHQGLPAAEKRYEALRRPPAQSFRKCRLDTARYISESFPRDTVLGSWWAGTLGYFSDRRVVNLDGVVNSGEFFRRYLRPDRVDRYIIDGPPSHLVDFFWRDPMHPNARPASRVFFWEHDKEHIFKRLQPRLRLVYRRPFRGSSGMYIAEVRK